MKFEFNHDKDTFSEACNFKNPNLPNIIVDAFNEALEKDNLESKTHILEDVMNTLKEKGLLSTPQDLFNAAFIIGCEVEKQDIQQAMKATIDKVRTHEIPAHLMNLSPDKILNKDKLLKHTESDDPDEF